LLNLIELFVLKLLVFDKIVKVWILEANYSRIRLDPELEHWKNVTVTKCHLSKLIVFRQCGGSGMSIPDPDFFYPSRIPDPITVTKEEGEKYVVCPTYHFL
jgi:hypothetical protein